MIALPPQALSKYARKLKKRAQQATNRLLDRLTRLAEPLNGPARAPESDHDDDEAGDVNLVIKGSANRSFLFAAKQVHIHGGTMLSVAIPATVLFVIVVAAVFMIVFNNRTSPSDIKNAVKPLLKGSSYALDLAVMPFKVANEADSSCMELASTLSNNIAEMTASKIKEQATSEGHSPSFEVWTPDQVKAGSLRPMNYPEEQGVARFAAERDVDIVLYGTISCSDGKITVDPQFYVGASYFKHAPELIGSYSFGAFSTPISKMTDSIALDEIKRELANRASNIARIGQGFEYYARGNSEGYENAARIFEDIIKSSTTPDKRGQAVLHYMLGNAYLRASRDDCDGIVDDMLRKAESNYQLAIDKEPQFASAYVGLGNIQSQWASNANTEEIDAIRGYLTKAEDYYLTALSARISPTNANVDMRVALSRAQIKIIEHDLIEVESGNATALLDAAESYLNSVVARFSTSGANANSMSSTAAYAYYMLGRVYMARGDDDKSLDNLNKAANLASEPHLKTDIAMDIADQQKLKGNVCEVANQYKVAIRASLCNADRISFTIQAQDFQAHCKLQLDSNTPLSASP